MQIIERWTKLNIKWTLPFQRNNFYLWCTANVEVLFADIDGHCCIAAGKPEVKIVSLKKCNFKHDAQWNGMDARKQLWKGFGREINTEDGVFEIGNPYIERCILIRATRWKKNQARSASILPSIGLESAILAYLGLLTDLDALNEFSRARRCHR